MKVDKNKQKQLRTWNDFRIVRVQHFVATVRLKKGKGTCRKSFMLQSNIAVSFACLSLGQRKYIEASGLVYVPQYVAKSKTKIQKYFGTDVAKCVFDTNAFLDALKNDEYRTAESYNIDVKAVGVMALATNLSLALIDSNKTKEEKEYEVAYAKWAIQYADYAMGDVKRIIERMCKQYEENEKILISI